MLRARRLSLLVLLACLSLPAGPAVPAGRLNQGPRVIEVTAKRHEFEPSEIRIKKGAKVQLKITSSDREHGVKFTLYPEGTKEAGTPGLTIASQQECFKVEKGGSTIVELTGQTPGTYSFKCCVSCGTGHSRMKGKLIVEP